MVKPNKVREWTESLDPVDWATESHILAHSHAYVIPKNGRIGDIYYRRNITVANSRLAMAGVRLAAVLNEIYDPPSSVIVPPEEGIGEIVYVIGNPDGNIHVDAYRFRELSQAIEGLSEDHHFTVIVYQADGLLEPPPKGTVGKAATNRVKGRVLKWLDPEAKNYKGVSKPDPMAALKQAMLYKPDLIYWWLGQSKGLAPNDEALSSLLDEIDRLNKSDAVIHIIERLPYPYRTGGKTPTVAEIIAEHTGGQHRFYNNSDIVGE